MQFDITLEPGVNLITGPTASGKTTLCRSMIWALTGHMTGDVQIRSAALHLPRMVVRREISDDGAHAMCVSDERGVLLEDSAKALEQAGVNPDIYALGVKGLYSDMYIEEPPSIIACGGQTIDITQMDLRTAEAGFDRRAGEREILQSVIRQTKQIEDCLAAEVAALSKEVVRLKQQEQLQHYHSMLHLMEGGECPLYPVTCNCQDEIVSLTKKDLKHKTAGRDPIPGFIDMLKKKEAELSGKELRLEILRGGLKNAKGKSHQEQLADIESQLNIGSAIIDAVSLREEWKKRRDAVNSCLKIKTILLDTAGSIGLNLTFDGKYMLNKRPVECASASEQLLLGYCLQQAAGVPLIIADDYGSLDLAWKEKVLAHARTTKDKVVVLTASSSTPRHIDGIACRHYAGRQMHMISRASL